MTAPTTIRVTFFDDASGERCPAECGLDLASADTLQFITERLKDKYGEAVVVEYLDLATPPDRYKETISRIRERNLPLPLIAINGVPRCSGGVDYRTLVEAIDTLREVSGG